MPKANLWIINYCILEMKAYNEHAISLPVYFKYVKTENCFSIKKKKKKKKKKNKFPTVGVEPRTFFFLSRERGWTTQHRRNLDHHVSTWTKNYNKFKGHKKEKA